MGFNPVKRTPLKRRPHRPSKHETRAKAHFRETVALECEYRCLWDGPECEGELDPHHIIRQSWLKGHYATMPEEEKWELVHSPANGVLICRHHHEEVTYHQRTIWRHEVPERTERWARDEGIEYRLEVECPSIHTGLSDAPSVN